MGLILIALEAKRMDSTPQLPASKPSTRCLADLLTGCPVSPYGPWQKSDLPKKLPSGAKAPPILLALSARLKPCPFKPYFHHGLLWPQVNLHVRRRKVQRVRLGVVVQIERLALAPVDQHGHQQHIAVHARRHNLVALDHAVFVVRAGRAPILLEPRKGVSAALRRMLLPVLVVEPDAVGCGQIVLFHRPEEPVHRHSSPQVVVPVPGPVHRAAGHQPPTHKQRQQQPPGAKQNHTPAAIANFVKHWSVQKGHGAISSRLNQLSAYSCQLTAVSRQLSELRAHQSVFTGPGRYGNDPLSL